MTKMAAMPVYGKKNFRNLLQNRKSYDLETWHATMGTRALYSSNGEPRWSSPFLRLGQIWSPVCLNGKTLLQSKQMGKLLQQITKLREDVYLKKQQQKTAKKKNGVVCPCPVYNHYFQTFFFIYLLANQSKISCEASLGRGNISFVKIVLVT